MNHAETVAKSLIERMVQGSRMEHRIDQSQGQHDFDLHLADGRIFAVEVTAAMDEIQTRTYAEIRNRRRGGFFVIAKLCKKGWLIHPNRGAPIRDIREKADSYLSNIEEAGFDSFSNHRPNHPAVESICRDLKISSGSVFDWKEPGLIGLALPGSGGFVEARHATDAAIHEAGKKDNRRKLLAAGTVERHLAVYIDPIYYLPWKALIDCEPPSEIPELPPEISHVWLFTESRSGDYVVWRASTSTPWQIHSYPK